MTPVDTVRRDARSHMEFLAFLFFPSLAGIVLFSWLSVWAAHQRGWEGEVLAIALGLVAALFMLSALIFGILLVSWLRNYKYAVRDAADFENDPERFRRRYREVFGPIPWR
jgi:hypothetical protein